MISESSEAQQANVAFQKMKRQSKISQNPAWNARVKQVGQRIIRVAPVKKDGWELVVFEDSDPNAFAMPGGKVGINTGLFSVATTDAMLASVIAHEVGHVVARHGAERASQGILAEIGGVLINVGLAAGTSMSPSGRAAILGLYGAGTTVGIMLPYSRTHEYESDRLGLLYMARAGYDPQAAVQFWKAMIRYGQKKDKGFKMPSFLSTHPLSDARIKRLETFMPEAMEEYKKSQQLPRASRNAN